MKLLSAILFAILAAFAVAQGIVIGYPHANKYIHPGQKLTVQVVQPDSIEGPIIIGIAIGISSCSATQPCQPPSQSVGAELYAGPYLPVLHQQDLPAGFYENFTVQIPTFLNKGKAQLNVVLAGLFGAGDFPSYETVNTTLNVVG